MRLELPTWTSSDDSIAWLGYQGLVMGVAAGEATISASWTADSWFMGLNQQCEYTPLNVLREALATVLPSVVRFDDVSLVASGVNRSAEFSTVNTATLNIRTTIGPDACGGDTFKIRVRFALPDDAADCCLYESTSNVKLDSGSQFQFAGDGFVFFVDPNNRLSRFVDITLKRLNPSGASNKLTINVGGSYRNGDSLSSKAFVRLTCD